MQRNKGYIKPTKISFWFCLGLMSWSWSWSGAMSQFFLADSWLLLVPGSWLVSPYLFVFQLLTSPMRSLVCIEPWIPVNALWPIIACDTYTLCIDCIPLNFAQLYLYALFRFTAFDTMQFVLPSLHIHCHVIALHHILLNFPAHCQSLVVTHATTGATDVFVRFL